MADLIDRWALLKELATHFNKMIDGKTLYHPYMALAMRDVRAAPAVDAVEVGSCDGCAYSHRKRPQKCSCCRRNPDMKDCYEEGG